MKITFKYQVEGHEALPVTGIDIDADYSKKGGEYTLASVPQEFKVSGIVMGNYVEKTFTGVKTGGELNIAPDPEPAP